MNIKKKLAAVLSLVMAVSMAMTACGKSDDDDDDDDTSSKKSISASSDDDGDKEYASSNDESGADDSGSGAGAETSEVTTTAEAAAIPAPEQTTAGEQTQTGESSTTTTTTTTAAANEPEVTAAATTKTESSVSGTEVKEGPEDQPIYDFFEGIKKGDAKLMFSAMPDKVMQTMIDYYGEDSADGMLVGSFSEELAEEYGDDYDITVKIVSKEALSKDDIEYEKQRFRNNYGEEIEITEGYKIYIKAVISGSKESDSDDGYFNSCKVDGKWCITDLF